MRKYNTVIIGGGPAGYTAALYAARAGLSVIVLEMLAPGGQMATTTEIDNYPVFEETVDGFDLAMNLPRLQPLTLNPYPRPLLQHRKPLKPIP